MIGDIIDETLMSQYTKLKVKLEGYHLLHSLIESRR